MKFDPPSRAASALTLGVVLLVASTIFAQQLSAPNSADKTTARLVADMISKYHISQKTIDDKVSAKLLDRFLTELDPQKLYFMQSDVDMFEQYRSRLDDLLKEGDVTFAYQAFDVHSKRLEERIKKAQTLIDVEHDFSVDEEMVIDGESLKWATSQEEIDERWRKRIKYDLLSLKLDKTEIAEGRERLHKRYDTLRRTALSTENGEKLEMYLSALAACFDPHSSYMSPQTLEDFQIQMRLSLEGIGAALSAEDGYTVVKQVVAGGAAEKDGRLKVNDKIIGVGQQDGEIVDVIEMKLSRVVRLIRGPKDTTVRLRVLTSTGETKMYDLTRQTIELKSSEVKGEIIQSGSRITGTNGRVGVINIPSFYRDFGGAEQGLDNFKSTARDVLKVLDDFKRQGGVDCIVIDLRMNGGGALSEAIEVTGLFIDRGPVVQVKEQDGRVRSHDDTEAGVAYSGPLVVLCNRLSASASEIFAAAIKDYRRGVVIGDSTTHGKGTVQNVMPVSNRLFQLLTPQDRGALKLTINQFYRVNGDSTQNLGVPSDVVLPSILDHMDLGESFMKDALEFDRVRPATHRTLGAVSPEMVSSLKEASQRRVTNDPEFQEIQQDIQKFLERKNRKTVSLNESVLRAEREEAKDEDEEKLEEEEPPTDGPIFAEGPYNDEVLHIALDYVGLLKVQQTAQSR